MQRTGNREVESRCPRSEEELIQGRAGSIIATTGGRSIILVDFMRSETQRSNNCKRHRCLQVESEDELFNRLRGTRSRPMEGDTKQYVQATRVPMPETTARQLSGRKDRNRIAVLTAHKVNRGMSNLRKYRWQRDA